MTTVLIVDDNIDMLELMAETLEMSNFQVLKAINGEEAWQHLNSLNTLNGVVVLSDVKMPKLSGFDFLRRVRTSERFSRLPVILMSGDQMDCTPAMAAKANDFVLKPFRIEVLQNKLWALSS